MDKPIAVGDLVMVVRGHQCAIDLIGGLPFTVLQIVNPVNGGWTCPVCGMRSAGGNEPAANRSGKDRVGIPLSWLRRIDPLCEPESVTEEAKARNEWLEAKLNEVQATLART